MDFQDRMLRWAFGVLALLWILPAASQVYPAKPVRIIVGQAPGSASDLLVRIIAQKLAESFGAMRRPITSALPPGAKGSSSRIGRVG